VVKKPVVLDLWLVVNKCWTASQKSSYVYIAATHLKSNSILGTSIVMQLLTHSLML